MLIFTVFLFGSLHLSIADPRNCTKEEICRPVPAEVCDNSRCQPFNFSDLAEIGKNGGDIYTWNIGQKFLLNGEIKWDILEQKECGITSHLIIFPHCADQSCSSSTNVTWVWYGEPDPDSGKYTVLRTDRAGDKYEDCFTYYEPGHSFVHRSCRVDPPSPLGQACATIYAVEVASGYCDRKPFKTYLQNLHVDLKKEIVDCV